MNTRHLACSIAVAAALVAAAPLFAVQSHTRLAGAAHSAVRHGSSAQTQNAQQEGQRIFDQNCARCHNAPEGFSPSITGTIVRHMRVRANLSRHDEQVLLHYFNP
jgi:cytochrome c5